METEIDAAAAMAAEVEAIEVDEDDLDEEMVEALRELSCHSNPGAQAELDRVAQLPPSEMAADIRKILNSLTPDQVASIPLLAVCPRSPTRVATATWRVSSPYLSSSPLPSPPSCFLVVLARNVVRTPRSGHRLLNVADAAVRHTAGGVDRHLRRGHGRERRRGRRRRRRERTAARGAACRWRCTAAADPAL